MITMSLMMQLAVKWGTRGLDDEDDTLEDFLRDMPFSAEVLAIFLWIKDFSGNAYRGARPYLPTPIKEITKAIDTFAD